MPSCSELAEDIDTKFMFSCKSYNITLSCFKETEMFTFVKHFSWNIHEFKCSLWDFLPLLINIGLTVIGDSKIFHSFEHMCDCLSGDEPVKLIIDYHLQAAVTDSKLDKS